MSKRLRDEDTSSSEREEGGSIYDGSGNSSSESDPSSSDDDCVGTSTRSARRQLRKEKDLKGTARRAYTVTSDLSKSFEEDEDPSTSAHREGVAILTESMLIFSALVHLPFLFYAKS